MPDQKSKMTPLPQIADEEIINNLDLLTEMENLEEWEEWEQWDDVMELLLLENESSLSKEEKS